MITRSAYSPNNVRITKVLTLKPVTMTGKAHSAKSKSLHFFVRLLQMYKGHHECEQGANQAITTPSHHNKSQRSFDKQFTLKQPPVTMKADELGGQQETRKGSATNHSSHLQQNHRKSPRRGAKRNPRRSLKSAPDDVGVSLALWGPLRTTDNSAWTTHKGRQ